ncbi:MAG: HEAT repeat domain-containing protein, partial [Methylocella sp.]
MLLQALDDPDDQVRSGALNAAASSNLEIAPETLIRLVQNDPVPGVRFLALATLSNYAEAPPADLDILGIAIHASADADPEIRTLAENLIDRLEAKEPVHASTPQP